MKVMNKNGGELEVREEMSNRRREMQKKREKEDNRGMARPVTNHRSTRLGLDRGGGTLCLEAVDHCREGSARVAERRRYDAIRRASVGKIKTKFTIAASLYLRGIFAATNDSAPFEQQRDAIDDKDDRGECDAGGALGPARFETKQCKQHDIEALKNRAAAAIWRNADQSCLSITNIARSHTTPRHAHDGASEKAQGRPIVHWVAHRVEREALHHGVHVDAAVVAEVGAGEAELPHGRDDEHAAAREHEAAEQRVKRVGRDGERRRQQRREPLVRRGGQQRRVRLRLDGPVDGEIPVDAKAKDPRAERVARSVPRAAKDGAQHFKVVLETRHLRAEGGDSRERAVHQSAFVSATKSAILTFGNARSRRTIFQMNGARATMRHACWKAGCRQSM
jgi:hypothetical protein